MKIHIVTVGSPKLDYAKAGWEEYIKRLEHYHQVRVTHIADKHNDTQHLSDAIKGTGTSYTVALSINARQYTSEQLADFLARRAQTGIETCFIIGGPDGLPSAVIKNADQEMGLSALTFPHDLAMVILAESLYRASTINSNHPYHR